MTEGYGQRFGERLRVENAPAMVTRALRNADIAVTEVRCDNPPLEMTGAFQREDAFVILSKKKLRDDRLSLSDVATEGGFTDQSHFTRMFNRIVGVSPGAWRRAVKE